MSWTPHAFWDASSSIGIGIIIGDKWRAWKLREDWRNTGKGRDIGWAEVVGFELLVLALLENSKSNLHLFVHGNNQGVVEGWWNNRSRNPEINTVFRCIHRILAQSQSTIYTRYVASKNNPADGPS